MDYKNKLHSQILISATFGIVGIAAFVIGLYLSFTHEEGFAQGFLTGTGAGLFAAGIIMIAQKVRILKSEEKLRKYKIENSDERNLFLGYKASYYTLTTSAMLMYISLFYFVFTNRAIFDVLIILIMAILLLRVLIYAVLKRLG